MIISKALKLFFIVIFMTIPMSADLFAINYIILPGCTSTPNLSSGFWLLPVDMIPTKGKMKESYTRIYSVSCNNKTCSLIKFPDIGTEIGIWTLTDAPDYSISMKKTTSNTINFTWGSYSFFLTKAGMRVIEDAPDFYAEGYAKCP